MWLLLLEAGVALFLLVFIVWWTLPSAKKPNPPAQEPNKQPDDRQQ
ncbi:hypothetical protein EDC30_1044 [Paucimonas lemoignei]|uniref:Uncharacterized protein n=1 Tax=Paucimonas lemoignei TaxID=29443 RepID=A0A4R3HVD8_PAULE|nr:hypothetical protein EDC30_1044 [Paucimonas lemoignei]